MPGSAGSWQAYGSRQHSMGLHIIRPNERVIMIPGIGIDVRGALASGEPIWWEVAGKTCLAAYQPKGAADYTTSKVNLASPGTYNCSDGATAPGWSAALGWICATGYEQLISALPRSSKPFSFLARFTASGAALAVRGYLARSSAARGTSIFHNGLSSIRVDSEGIAVIGSSAFTFGIGVDAVIGFTYSAVGAYVFYLGGTSYGGGTNDQSLTAGTTLFLSSGTQGLKGSCAAIAQYDAVLAPEEVATVSTRMAAL